MPRRRWRDYDYGYGYYPKSKPIAVKDGIKAKSQHGKIGETWWSGRWIDVLHSFGMGARLGRGRSYARRGQVISIDITPGNVAAQVQGSRSKPYSVTMDLAPLSDADWQKVADAMAAQAIFAAKLLAGEMPQNVEEAFQAAKVSLFPESQSDLDTDCSCPDWANPCKHIAAVYFLLAEEFDRDPFMIFKLRGRTKEQIIEALRARRSAPDLGDEPQQSDVLVEEEDTPLEECLDAFWASGQELQDVRPRLARPAVEGAVLKRLGESPFVVRKDNVADLLGPAYRAVSQDFLAKGLGSQEGKE